MVTHDFSKSQTVSASRVEMTQLVMPQHTNAVGTAFGGQVMSWIDICAAVSAQRFCRCPVVTASIDGVHFIEPIRHGHVVVLRSQVNASFKSSMEIGVKVITEHPLTGERKQAMRAYLTFVALGDDGKPTKLKPLILETEADKRRFEDAAVRREYRLKTRKGEVVHNLNKDA